MRQFIRHPSEIPLEFVVDNHPSDPQSMRDISEGGLSFICHNKLELGSEITITIKVLNPEIALHGRVVWNHPLDSGKYLVGVKFNETEHFRARMAEQICHIEHYRREVSREEGRELTSEEAANEWISRYAAKFPD